jgi:hypothetical protein
VSRPRPRDATTETPDDAGRAGPAGHIDVDAVRAWIGDIVGPDFTLDLEKERAWATTLRVTVGGATLWFKACQPVQAFEPRLTAELARRWPDRLPRVLGFDEARAWLLTADAGAAIGTLGNDPEIWLRALPRYAELQLGEAARAGEHLALGVPDLRLERLPGEFDRLLQADLPLGPTALARLRAFAPRFRLLCEDLAGAGVGPSIQHDDLHVNGLFVRDGELRFLDWGDASIAPPFFSLVVTFWFLERQNGLARDDPWFARLRDAYLEPWGGSDLREAFALAFRIGLLAHPIAWLRHREPMVSAARRDFDRHFAELLDWVIARGLG